MGNRIKQTKRSLKKKNKYRKTKRCGAPKQRSTYMRRSGKNCSKSKSRSRMNSRSKKKCQKGGSPAYKLFKDNGLLSQLNPFAKSLPITYTDNSNVHEISKPYKVSV
jgi:hypothetical protein